MNRPTDRPTDRPTVGSLFAGVGGIDHGFERAGFRTVWQVEVDVDATGVLADRFATARQYRDVRHVGAVECVIPSAIRIKRLSWPTDISSSLGLALARENVLAPVDWIVGGFPCQDVSVAGKRAGLIGARTGLFWQFMRIVDELKPMGVLLENVPGLLSTNRRRADHRPRLGRDLVESPPRRRRQGDTDNGYRVCAICRGVNMMGCAPFPHRTGCRLQKAYPCECPKCGEASTAKDAYCTRCSAKVTKKVRPAPALPAPREAQP